MANIVLHPATRRLYDSYLQSPSHAVCLTGQEGAGLRTLAKNLAASLVSNEKLVTMIGPEKGLISIDRIRQLYEQTRSIQQGKRVIIIDDADSMSADAQNSLLKLLEEPVKNVHFILTTHHVARILATIRSRVQEFSVLPLNDTVSKELLAHHNLSPTEQLQALFLASGKPAELTRLAVEKDYFAARTTIVTDARSFLQTGTYERLVIIKKYSDRVHALEFLTMCAQLLSFSVLKQRNYAAADGMAVLDTVMARIDANGHVRTHLMYLVTKLT